MRNDLTVDQLFERITNGIRFGSPVHGDVRSAHRLENIDLLRCFDELLSGDDLNQCTMISRAQSIVQYEMLWEASGFLTQAMLDVTERIYDSREFSLADIQHHAQTRRQFCAYAFTNMDKIDGIMFLLEERGITDVKKVETVMEEMSINDLSKSLLEGAL